MKTSRKTLDRESNPGSSNYRSESSRKLTSQNLHQPNVKSRMVWKKIYNNGLKQRFLWNNQINGTDLSQLQLTHSCTKSLPSTS